MIINHEWFRKLAESHDPIVTWNDLKYLGKFEIPKNVPDYTDTQG